MKNLCKISVLGALLIASASYASATTINAVLDLAGSGSYDATNIQFQTAAFPVGTDVINGVAYSGPVTFTLTTPFAWGSVNYGASGTQVFTTNVGLSFFLQTATGVLSNGGNELTLTGTGLFEEAGYVNTPGTFILTSQYNGQPYDSLTSFSSSASTSATPEPSSLILLGSGLMGGAGLLFRKRKLA